MLQPASDVQRTCSSAVPVVNVSQCRGSVMAIRTVLVEKTKRAVRPAPVPQKCSCAIRPIIVSLSAGNVIMTSIVTMEAMRKDVNVSLQ